MKKQVRRLVVLALVVGMLATSVLGTSAAFDPVYYAAQNPDVVKALGNSPAMLKLHYDMFGRKEARMSNKNDVEGQLRKLFNADDYAKLFPDVKKAFGNDKEAMFNHYIAFGLLEGRRPSEKVSQATAVSLKKTVEKAMKDAGLAATPGSPEVVAEITGETSSVASAGAAVQQTVAKVADVVAKEVTATVEEVQNPAPSSSSSSGGSSTPTKQPTTETTDTTPMGRAARAVTVSLNDLDLSGDNLTETQAVATVTGNAVDALTAGSLSNVEVEWKKTSYKKADGKTNGELKGTLTLYRHVGMNTEVRYVPVSKVIYSDINWEFKVAEDKIDVKIKGWKDQNTTVQDSDVRNTSGYSIPAGINVSITHIAVSQTDTTPDGKNGEINVTYTLTYSKGSVTDTKTLKKGPIPIKSAATIILAKAKARVQAVLDEYEDDPAGLFSDDVTNNDLLIEKIYNTSVSDNNGTDADDPNYTVSSNGIKVELGTWTTNRPTKEADGTDGAYVGKIKLSKGDATPVTVDVNVVYLSAATQTLNDAVDEISGNELTDDTLVYTVSGINGAVSDNDALAAVALKYIKENKAQGINVVWDTVTKWVVDFTTTAKKAIIKGKVILSITDKPGAGKREADVKVTLSGNTPSN